MQSILGERQLHAHYIDISSIYALPSYIKYLNSDIRLEKGMNANILPKSKGGRGGRGGG